MSDLTDEQLANLIDTYANERYPAKGLWVIAGLEELQRRRAEQAAGREHVERVVREEVVMSLARQGTAYDIRHPDDIAGLVADRLSVPVLSNELGDRMQLWNAINAYACGCGGDTAKYVYGHSHRQEQVRLIEEALDRLIAAGKP